MSVLVMLLLAVVAGLGLLAVRLGRRRTRRAGAPAVEDGGAA
jgi:hypothetical protein